jgi:hypothetical protein
MLVRLEARNDGMTARMKVLGCVLTGRIIATADMTALGAAAQMEPPAVCG